MNAKTWNTAMTAAFTHGGRGDILLWGTAEAERQAEEKEQAHKIMMRGLREFRLKKCPCGCGLKEDMCAEYTAYIVAEHEEIPF